MATLAPLRPEAHNDIAHEEKLTRALRPWRRRLSLQQAVRWTANGLVVGMLLACLLLLVSRFIPFASVLFWAMAAIVITLLCAAGLALYSRPSFADSARRVDESR